MGRLSSLKPQLGSLSPSIGYAPQDERERNTQRDQNQPWRRWYKTARWQKLRWSVLVRDRFRCSRCGKLDGNTSQLVANHKRPHRGNELMFWDDTNIETVCKTCHDGVIQSEERRQL